MNFRRTSALVLSGILLMSTFAGCGNKTQSASGANNSANSGADIPSYMNPVGKFPITKDKITVKAAVGTKSTNAKDWNTLEEFKRLEKLTNIHWDFQYIDSTDATNFSNQLNVRMAGNDFPEVFMNAGYGMSSDTEEAYGPGGKILDLTPYLKYAPHFVKLRDSDKTLRLSNTASNGKIYGLPSYNTSNNSYYASVVFARKSWMDKAGIAKIPETTDELYTMLKAFKDKAPNGDPKTVVPMATQFVGYLRISIQSAFQAYTGGSVSDEWDVDSNGKVVYLPEEKGYKEYLEYCHKLYADGLLDPDFVTIKSDQYKAKILTGNVGIPLGTNPTVYNGSKFANDDEVELPPLTTPTNSKKITQSSHSLYTTAAIITKNCKHPEAVMSWFDLFYRTSDEAVDGFCGNTGSMGYENENWKYTDSSKTKYTVLGVNGDKNANLNLTTCITWGMPGFIHIDAIRTDDPMTTSMLEQNKQKLQPYQKDAYPLDNVRLTKVEQDKATIWQQDLDNYQSMMEAKFMTGQEDLSGFDNFVAQLKKYKCDDLKKIRQDSYDRFIHAK